MSVALGRDAVWYAASSSRRLSKLDPRLVETSETFSVGRGAAGVAVDGRTTRVANSRDGTVSRIDPGTSPQTIPIGEAPGDIVAAYGAVWTTSSVPRS